MIRRTACRALTLIISAGMGLHIGIAQTSQAPVSLSRIIELPGVRGGFDHIAYDPVHKRLLVAAEDQGKVEVVDLRTGRLIKSIGGFKNPHSILVLPGKSEFLVTDSGPGASALVSDSTLAKDGHVPLALGANCLLFDPASNRAFVTAGGDRVGQKFSVLQTVDLAKDKVVKSLTIPALHLQPMALDPARGWLYVNIADQDTIAVYNMDRLTPITRLHIPRGHKNSPIAYDPVHHRLFVVAADPGILLQLDAYTGAIQSLIKAPFDPDDIGYDEQRQLVLVPGEKWMGVYDVSDPGQLKLVQRVSTGEGARTGLEIEPLKKFVVAVPAKPDSAARLLVFDIR